MAFDRLFFGPFLALFGAYKGHFGNKMGWFGVILGAPWDHFGIVSASCWCRLGVVLTSFWAFLWPLLPILAHFAFFFCHVYGGFAAFWRCFGKFTSKLSKLMQVKANIWNFCQNSPKLCTFYSKSSLFFDYRTLVSLRKRSKSTFQYMKVYSKWVCLEWSWMNFKCFCAFLWRSRCLLNVFFCYFWPCLTFFPYLGLYRANFWPFWDRHRVNGPKWGDFGPFFWVDPGSLRDHFDIVLGSFWCRFDIILGYIRNLLFFAYFIIL